MQTVTEAPYQPLLDREPIRYLGVVVGCIIYAFGVNFFIVPAGLYSGGVMGFVQLIRTLLVDAFSIDFGTFDFAGILYFLLNLPIMIVAWKHVEHRFVLKTILAALAITAFTSIIPIYDLMDGHDVFVKSIIGAFFTGSGVGVILYMGGTSGGMDMVGLMMIKAGSRTSVGQVNLICNIILYSACALLFDVQTAIFSVVSTLVFSFTVDRLHSQNINVEVTIITKVDTTEMEHDIFTELHRGATRLFGEGAYTSEKLTMLYVMVSKYEVNHLHRIVNKHDPHAFFVAKKASAIFGNYIRKM